MYLDVLFLWEMKFMCVFHSVHSRTLEEHLQECAKASPTRDAALSTAHLLSFGRKRQVLAPKREERLAYTCAPLESGQQ